MLLKGKSKSVATYEPLELSKVSSKNYQDYLIAFELLKSDRAKAKQFFNELSIKYPDDTLIKYHQSRLNAGESGTTIILPYK